MTVSFIKEEGDLDTETQQEHNAKMEAEARVMHLQAKESQALPTTTRS